MNIPLIAVDIAAVADRKRLVGQDGAKLFFVTVVAIVVAGYHRSCNCGPNQGTGFLIVVLFLHYSFAQSGRFSYRLLGPTVECCDLRY
jgi:hypothetical protein